MRSGRLCTSTLKIVPSLLWTKSINALCRGVWSHLQTPPRSPRPYTGSPWAYIKTASAEHTCAYFIHACTNKFHISDDIKKQLAICRSWWWRRGVPVINPYDSIYSCWCFYVLLTDATYTAFIVPIGVGFDTSDVAWDWAGYCDFIAGQACQHTASPTYFCCCKCTSQAGTHLTHLFLSRQHVHSSKSDTCGHCGTCTMRMLPYCVCSELLSLDSL